MDRSPRHCWLVEFLTSLFILKSKFILFYIFFYIFLGLFRDDLLAEWTKLEKGATLTTTYPSQPTTMGLPAVHDSTTWPPSRLIDHLKLSIRHIIRDSSKLANQDITDLLQLTQRTLQNRKDVTPVVFKCIQHLTFDFLFILCNLIIFIKKNPEAQLPPNFSTSIFFQVFFSPNALDQIRSGPG